MGADMFERLRELRDHKRKRDFAVYLYNRSFTYADLIGYASKAEAHRTAYNMKKYWFMSAL